jgi:coproporphyrinogen III oxidase-like Fe-S oxidoreductase
LEADKTKLKAEVNELSTQAAKVTELKQQAEEGTNRLKAGLQAADWEKQALLQNIQEFTVVVDYWKNLMKNPELNTVISSNRP